MSALTRIKEKVMDDNDIVTFFFIRPLIGIAIGLAIGVMVKVFG